MITYQNTNIESSDGNVELLRKILLRLNWSAAGTPGVPSANVAVTNFNAMPADLTAIHANTNDLHADNLTIIAALDDLDLEIDNMEVLLTSIDNSMTTAGGLTSNIYVATLAGNVIMTASEVHLGSIAADSTTIAGCTCSADTKLTTTNVLLSQIENNTDGLETLITASNALLTTIDADTGRLTNIDTNVALTATRCGDIDTKLITTNVLLSTIDADTGTIAGHLFDSGQSVASWAHDSYTELNTLRSAGIPIKDAVTGSMAHVSDAGVLSTFSAPIELEINRSNLYGELASVEFNLMGRRAGFNSTSTLQDVGEWLGTGISLFPELTATEAMEVVSSDAQDDATPGGTGAWTIRIVYINAAYAIASFDVTLNGTAVVNLGGGFRAHAILWMEVLTGGTSEVAIGNIDLRTVAGAIVHERISAGGNKSLSARFMVPDGYSGHINYFSGEAINTTQDIRLRATVRSLDRALNAKYLFQDIMYLGSGTSLVHKIDYLKFPARSRIKVSTIAGATAVGNRVDITFNMILIADP